MPISEAAGSVQRIWPALISVERSSMRQTYVGQTCETPDFREQTYVEQTYVEQTCVGRTCGKHALKGRISEELT
jgi:hypothetical protein